MCKRQKLKKSVESLGRQAVVHWFGVTKSIDYVCGFVTRYLSFNGKKSHVPIVIKNGCTQIVGKGAL